MSKSPRFIHTMSLIRAHRTVDVKKSPFYPYNVLIRAHRTVDVKKSPFYPYNVLIRAHRTVDVKKSPFYPYNGRPFKKNGQRTGIEQ